MEQTTHKNSDISIASVEEQIMAIPAAGRDLTLVSAAHAVIHAIGVLMPLIYPIIQVEYHLSYTQIGLIVAIPNAVGGFLQIGFGLLSRYILRKFMPGDADWAMSPPTSRSTCKTSCTTKATSSAYFLRYCCLAACLAHCLGASL